MATWYQYEIEIDHKYAGATFTVYSVWGNGGAENNHWGWGVPTPMEIDGPFENAGKVFILVKLNAPGAPNCNQFALCSRVKLANGSSAVFAHLDNKQA